MGEFQGWDFRVSVSGSGGLGLSGVCRGLQGLKGIEGAGVWDVGV